MMNTKDIKLSALGFSIAASATILFYYFPQSYRPFYIFLYLATSVSLALIWVSKDSRRNKKTVYSLAQKIQGGVSATSQQLIQICEMLASSSETQQKSIENSEIATDEISAMVAQTMETSGLIKQNSQKINSVLELSNSKIQQVFSTFKHIEDHNKETLKTIAESESHFSEVFKIYDDLVAKTQIINDIVFQTKLLSFNASVEAARAGEHGKGFAIVAEEIGNLASMSGRAAKEIIEGVTSSQKQISEIIRKIHSSIEKIVQLGSEKLTSGAKELKNFQESYQEFSFVTQETDLLVNQISQAVKEQKFGIDELLKSNNMITRTSHDNDLVIGQTIEISKILAKEISNTLAIFSESELSTIRRYKLEMIEWDQKYSLHVDEMDSEHQKLLNHMNELINTLNQRADTQQVQAAFTKMAEFAIEHFKHEEEFMEKTGYPDLASHRKVHENLINRVNKIGQSLSTGQIDPIEIISFLKSWLFTHILGVDTKYGQHYKESHPTNRKVG